MSGSYKKRSINERDGMPSKDHWEVKFSCTKGIPDDPEGAFLPMSAKVRPQPHDKINDMDY